MILCLVTNLFIDNVPLNFYPLPKDMLASYTHTAS